MLRPALPDVGGAPPLRNHRASGVSDDTSECSSVNFTVRSDVEGESDDVGGDIVVVVPLDCHGTAAARAVFLLFDRFSSFSIEFFVYYYLSLTTVAFLPSSWCNGASRSQERPLFHHRAKFS